VPHPACTCVVAWRTRWCQRFVQKLAVACVIAAQIERRRSRAWVGGERRLCVSISYVSYMYADGLGAPYSVSTCAIAWSTRPWQSCKTMVVVSCVIAAQIKRRSSSKLLLVTSNLTDSSPVSSRRRETTLRRNFVGIPADLVHHTPSPLAQLRDMHGREGGVLQRLLCRVQSWRKLSNADTSHTTNGRSSVTFRTIISLCGRARRQF